MFKGQKCIVRARDAGVHYGTVVSVDGRTVVLTDARRIWSWCGAFTLSEVARVGITTAESRIACVVPEIAILDACEVIPASEQAAATIEAGHE
jgi:hypothetical protein